MKLFLPVKAASVLVAIVLGVSATALNADTFGSGDNTFIIDFTTIGNPGNPADTVGEPNPAGSVGYSYRIGTHEISRDMIQKANTLGELGIALVDMTGLGGNGPNQPATGVSWNQAARFVNWLNVSSGFSVAYKFEMQPGDPAAYDSNANLVLWQAGDDGYNPANPYRNSNAVYFLPSVDEWYKAAYYNPATAGYFSYATGSNSIPTATSGGTDPGTAVIGQPAPAAITNAGGPSPYGTMGQTGNVFEHQESAWNNATPLPESSRALRGGFWGFNAEPELSSAGWLGYNPTATGANVVGFRVASVPEPTAAMLALFSATICLLKRSRK